MKKIFIIFILYISLTSITAFADNTDDTCLWAKNYDTYSEKCNNKELFELYECRVTNLCTPCTNKNSKKIFETEEFKEAKEYMWSSRLASTNILDPLEKVQKIYKSNMNSIYKCVLIDIQERWLKYLEEVISATDKTNLVWKELNTKISSEKTKLTAKKSALKCSWWWEDDSDDRLIKKDVLDQTSLEFCTYIYYLQYLKDVYKNPQNILGITDEELQSVSSWNSQWKTYQVSEISSWSTTINNAINKEIERTFKVFPLAYYAYSEYEDNYVLHLLLTLIKQDFVIARDQLAKVLWPINQVAYKIKDAMKKY